jgi:DNA replication protein DnaC
MDMSNIIEGIAAKSAEVNAPTEADYIGEDGLLYCGKCHTKKQTRVTILDRELTPYVTCRCRREELYREEKEREEREKAQRTERNRRNCFPDHRLMEWTFANCDNAEDKLMISMKKYCDNFDKMYRSGCGIILYGSVGVGKTYTAACIANELIDKGRSVYMTDFSRVINTIWGLNSGKQAFLDDLNTYDLLIIDDLAAERDTAYASEIVMNVIDSRCKSGKPLIVTTNLKAAELFDPEGIRKQRIYSRICEMCLPIEFKGGKDRRKRKMSENIAANMELLGL